MTKIKRFLQVALCTLLVVSLYFFANTKGYAGVNAVTVNKGDTLFHISRKYDLSVQELKEYNNLKHDTIYVGQKLRIAGKQIEPMYVVVAGSFAKKTNADKQISLLRKKGIKAIVVQKVINNQTYYRIQAGVFWNKHNAETQTKVLHSLGIKDSYVLTQNPLHLNGFQTGSTYNELVRQFGKPANTEDYLNIRSLYYQSSVAGVRLNFNMKNSSIIGLQVYPDYVTVNSIPKNKSNVIALYGYPNKAKKVSCYESATCEQFIYMFHRSKLIVQFDRDLKTVQYLDLSKLP